jgi:hypothetical protein
MMKVIHLDMAVTHKTDKVRERDLEIIERVVRRVLFSVGYEATGHLEIVTVDLDNDGEITLDK